MPRCAAQPRAPLPHLDAYICASTVHHSTCISIFRVMYAVPALHAVYQRPALMTGCPNWLHAHTLSAAMTTCNAPPACASLTHWAPLTIDLSPVTTDARPSALTPPLHVLLQYVFMDMESYEETRLEKVRPSHHCRGFRPESRNRSRDAIQRGEMRARVPRVATVACHLPAPLPRSHAAVQTTAPVQHPSHLSSSDALPWGMTLGGAPLLGRPACPAPPPLGRANPKRHSWLLCHPAPPPQCWWVHAAACCSLQCGWVRMVIQGGPGSVWWACGGARFRCCPELVECGKGSRVRWTLNGSRGCGVGQMHGTC
jgi:hypothetical protein